MNSLRRRSRYLLDRVVVRGELIRRSDRLLWEISDSEVFLGALWSEHFGRFDLVSYLHNTIKRVDGIIRVTKELLSSFSSKLLWSFYFLKVLFDLFEIKISWTIKGDRKG